MRSKNLLRRIVLFSLLLMLIIAPFAGIAPLMLILLGFGLFWMIGFLVQAFFTADVEGEESSQETTTFPN